MEKIVKDAGQYSALTLAYIGDAVYDLMIRTKAVSEGDKQTEKLHREVTGYVSAPAQDKIMRALIPYLTEEEAAVYRRGKNAKPATKAKNATTEQYLTATGFEALIGYLYLSGQPERLKELVKKGIELFEKEKKGTRET